jgi:hypothetical protein
MDDLSTEVNRMHEGYTNAYLIYDLRDLSRQPLSGAVPLSTGLEVCYRALTTGQSRARNVTTELVI